MRLSEVGFFKEQFLRGGGYKLSGNGPIRTFHSVLVVFCFQALDLIFFCSLVQRVEL